jgi:hypothetical protein
VGNKRLRLVLTMIFALSGGAVRSQQQTGHPVYVSCTLGDTVRSVLYMSGIFAGDSALHVRYEEGFRTNLRRTFPGVYGDAHCRMSDREQTAEHESVAELNRVSGMYRQVIPTGWVYTR